tara:strand:+ start:4985 stop:7015 length:2031 start_codon:yes stop_codon:yes gene_type:complete
MTYSNSRAGSSEEFITNDPNAFDNLTSEEARAARIAELRRRSAERRAAGPQVGDTVDISEELAFENSLTSRRSETQPVTKNVSPPPENLNEFQEKSFVELIQTDPEGWSEDIFGLQEKYPELAKVQSFSQETIDAFDSDTYDNYNRKLNTFQLAKKLDLKPLSATTGTVVNTADKSLKSFAVTAETSLTNFLSTATKLDNALFDLPGEIKSTAALIAGGAQSFVGQIGNSLSDALIGGVKTGLSTIATTIFSSIPQYNIALRVVKKAQGALLGPVSKVFKGMNCLASKVSGALQGALEDMLTAFVKNSLNAPACAIQQFIGSVLTKVNSLIDGIVGPLTGGISKVLGPLFKVRDILGAGINLADKIGDFFNCSPEKVVKKQNSTNTWKVDGSGQKSKSTSEKQNILDKATAAANNASKRIEKFGSGSLVKEKLTKFEEEYGQWTIFGSKVSDASDQNIGTDCYTGNVFKCGAPTGEIFGGDGIGGAGKVLFGNFINKLDPDDLYGEIKRTASIIGFEVTDPGSGYTEEPDIAFNDNCNQGYGAFGKVIIDRNVNSPTYGQITNVIITSEGENYPIDLPGEVGNVFLKEIIVEDGGTGYEDAFIEDDCMNLQVVDGKITGVEITCQKPYDSIPNIIISNEGIGAVLRPIMSSTPTKLDQPVLQSVDCVGAFPKPGEY